MKRCEICGTDLDRDLFASVAGKTVCSICTVNFVGGDFDPAHIAKVRQVLNLQPGEYLQQDNAAEARRILGRPQ